MYTKSKHIGRVEYCILILIGYQKEVMDSIHDKERKLVELTLLP